VPVHPGNDPQRLESLIQRPDQPITILGTMRQKDVEIDFIRNKE